MIIPQTDITVDIVRDVLGESSTDVGTLCRSPKINMWSRYKPVPFANIIAFNDTRITFQGAPSWGDTPITEGVDGMNRPWYQGGYTRRMYNIPQISVINDLFNSDWTAAKASSKWSYTPPTGYVEGSPYVYPFRLGDFAGYNHDARCPLSVYINFEHYKTVDGEYNGMVYRNGHIYVGLNNLDDFLDNDLCKSRGELSLWDIAKQLTFTMPPDLYLCVVIRNSRTGLSSTYSKPVNILDPAGRSFDLIVNNPSTISTGGIGLDVTFNDVLQVGVYLCFTPDSSSGGLGYSLNNGQSLVVKNATVGGDRIDMSDWYRVTYDVLSFHYGVEGYLDEFVDGLSVPQYFNDGDGPFNNPPDNNIYKATKGFKNVSVRIKIISIEKNYSGEWHSSSIGNFKIKFGLTSSEEGSFVFDESDEIDSNYCIGKEITALGTGYCIPYNTNALAEDRGGGSFPFYPVLYLYNAPYNPVIQTLSLSISETSPVAGSNIAIVGNKRNGIDFFEISAL